MAQQTNTPRCESFQEEEEGGVENETRGVSTVIHTCLHGEHNFSPADVHGNLELGSWWRTVRYFHLISETEAEFRLDDDDGSMNKEASAKRSLREGGGLGH